MENQWFGLLFICEWWARFTELITENWPVESLRMFSICHLNVRRLFAKNNSSKLDEISVLSSEYAFDVIAMSRGGSSRGAAGLQPSLKNVRQKIPPNRQTRLKFGFCYENSTTQSFSVLPTPFLLNVSQESNKANVSLFCNDAAYAMTFSAHLPMNLAISGLSSAQP